MIIDAIRRSFDERQSSPNVFNSTAGLIFFGTPFRGRAGLSLDQWVDRLMQANTNNPHFKIWQETMTTSVPGGSYLWDLVESFCETRCGDHPIPVWCFYEDLPSPVGRMLGDGSDTEVS